jgi:hypothetical protein
MVQRSINKIVMFPVDNRDVPTLIPLIEKHVAPASSIFADSWAAYLHLSELTKYWYGGPDIKEVVTIIYIIRSLILVMCV